MRKPPDTASLEAWQTVMIEESKAELHVSGSLKWFTFVLAPTVRIRRIAEMQKIPFPATDDYTLLVVPGPEVGLSKDEVAALIRSICTQVKAVAIFQRYEGWSRVQAATETTPTGTMANDTQAKEVIYISIETPEWMRCALVPFSRTERNTGEVTGFEDPIILKEFRQTAPRNPQSQRFQWLLPENPRGQA